MKRIRNEYQDLLVIVVGFCLIGLLVSKGYDKAWGNFLIYGALTLGVLGIFSKTITHRVTRGWQAFGKLLGKVSSAVILSALFILMISPMAIIKKLMTKKETRRDSTWLISDMPITDFEKLW